MIAKQGTSSFYRGDIAQAVVAAQQRSRSPVPDEGRGRMTLRDLADYRAKVREPLAVSYRGYTVASMPPPSSGAITIGQMLKMVERFPIGDTGQGFGFGAANTLHVMAEAMRLAFADRAVWLGDEDFVRVPKAGLLNPDYIDSRAVQINLGSRLATPAAGNPLPYDSEATGERNTRLPVIEAELDKPSHTTHFSVIDRWGNVVSSTTTIESLWGSGILVPGYGILLNNELTDFNLDPTLNAQTGNPGANDVAPGKRPRSSMAPTIVFKGHQPVLAYGSPGGATIINTVFNTTLNLIDHGMSIQQAINAPRLSVTSALGTVSCEGTQAFMQPKFSIAAQDDLRALGHLLPAAMGSNGCTAQIGSVQGLVIDAGRGGRRYGGADLRREGTVAAERGPGHDHGHERESDSEPTQGGR
jgi:gamma-glutamyltranspeptidase / glutathione hydrolase